MTVIEEQPLQVSAVTVFRFQCCYCKARREFPIAYSGKMLRIGCQGCRRLHLVSFDECERDSSDVERN